MGKSIALVTGGLGGIGTEISKKLSENGSYDSNFERDYKDLVYDPNASPNC